MEAGIASVVAIQARETKVEVGLIGREGMSGLADRAGKSPFAAFDLYTGGRTQAQRISARRPARGIRCERIHCKPRLLKFVQAFMIQTSAHGHFQCTRQVGPAFGTLDFDGS